MAAPRRRRRIALAMIATTLTLGTIAAGCGGDDEGGSTGSGGDLSGKIVIDGSSTVGPLTSIVAEDFKEQNGGVDVSVGTSGTGGGFEVFCKGETDISNASREIKEEEAAACAEAGVEYEELRVASDGITVVTKKGGAVGDNLNLTLEQLKAIWIKGSKINDWSQIPGGGFPSAKLTLAGADSQSGTYDFFNETVLGEDAAGEVLSPRQDYSASADDNVTVKAVTGSAQGLGYFGFTYYEENSDSLDAIALEGVTPSAETITDGSYPLSRPLYIYVSKASLAKPEVLAFTKYYVENAISLAEELQFVPAPQDSIDADLQKLAAYE